MPITGGGGGGGGEVYVNRGDPATYDWDQGDLTINSAWHDLDVSGVVTDADATLLHLHILMIDGVTGTDCCFRKNGQSNEWNQAKFRIMEANKYHDWEGFVVPDEDLIIEYKIGTGMDEVKIIVRGWWKPG